MVLSVSLLLAVPGSERQGTQQSVVLVWKRASWRIIALFSVKLNTGGTGAAHGR